MRAYLIGYDYNSLYAFCLLGRFPVDEYSWVAPEKLNEIDWSSDEVAEGWV